MDVDVLRKRFGPAVVLCAIVVAAAILVSAFASATLEARSIQALIYMVMVVGLYSFSGVSGVVSFGHLSFAMIAAYTWRC